MNIKHKSLIAPINQEGNLLLQDRAGHLPPPWGFFGGSIENGESPLVAVIRETEEELGVGLTEKELEYIGEFEFKDQEKRLKQISHVYLWRTDLAVDEFNLMEGAGLKYVNFDKAKELLSFGGDFEILEAVAESSNKTSKK